METLTQSEAIGNKLAFELKTGDGITVFTEEGGKTEMTVIDIRNNSPTQEGQETEITCEPHEDDIEENEVVVLYARVVEMYDMGIDYDLYAVRLLGSSVEDLGEVTKMEVD